MAIQVPDFATEVAALASEAPGTKAGKRFSTVGRYLLSSVNAYLGSAVAPIANGSVTAAKLASSAVTLAKLAVGVAPSHIVKFAGTATATASATVTVSVPGVLSSDLVFASVKSRVSGTAYILTVVASTDTVTIVGSASFSAGDILQYQVIRAAA